MRRPGSRIDFLAHHTHEFNSSNILQDYVKDKAFNLQGLVASLVYYIAWSMAWTATVSVLKKNRRPHVSRLSESANGIGMGSSRCLCIRWAYSTMLSWRNTELSLSYLCTSGRMHWLSTPLIDQLLGRCDSSCTRLYVTRECISIMKSLTYCDSSNEYAVA